MSAYLQRLTEYAVPCLIFWGILGISVMSDRSRFRNCIYLLFAALSTVPLFCAATGSHAAGTAKALTTLIFTALLSVPAVLVFNGVTMFKKEGRSLANMLSFLLGIMIGIGEICFFAFFVLPLFFSEQNAQIVNLGMRVLLFVSLSVMYVAVIFASFMVYTVLLQFIPTRRDFDFIIIHGSGLIRGREVSKLLSDRIDKAIEVYARCSSPPILIPSGGKGNDEEISEAEAMEQYLISKGIPTEHIIREDRSKTTRENLLFSKEIIDKREDPKYCALVTSNYHVYRALSICREIGLKCTGIGAHVALYYWPSALLREFAAILSVRKNFLMFVLGWILCLMPAMYSIMTSVIQ